MPTPHKASENMRKHLTNAERESRQAAEAGLRRKGRVTLPCPAWLGPESRKIFEATKRRLRGLDLLDSSDADLLALYADAVHQYQAQMASAAGDMKAIAAAQAWSRLALQYAEKLGISPAAKARLARKRAEPETADELESLLDEFVGYANGGK